MIENRHLSAVFLAVSLVVLTEKPSIAASCGDQFPKTWLGIEQAARENEVEIPESLRLGLFADFCSEANRLITEARTKKQITVPQESIDDVGTEVFSDLFLKRIGGRKPSLAAEMTDNLRHPEIKTGWTMPKGRKLVVVTVNCDTCPPALDGYRLNSDTISYGKRVVVENGRVELVGFRSNSDVCRASFDTDYPNPMTVDCKAP